MMPCSTFPLGNGTWLKWMNFGPSYTSKSRTVNDIFRDQLPISFQLGVMALAARGHHRHSAGHCGGSEAEHLLGLWRHGDRDSRGVAAGIIVLGPILVWIFGVNLKILPPTGWGAKPPFVLGIFPSNIGPDYFRYAIMPAFALGFASSALIARLTRASLLQTSAKTTSAPRAPRAWRNASSSLAMP